MKKSEWKTMSERSLCRLCNQKTNLLKSHIIPEFVYKPMYDDLHRYMVLKASSPRKKVQRLQKGLYERLLCASCEEQFCRYEKYVKEALYDGREITAEPQGVNGVILRGFDYGPIKLYFLSLLWRMSISSLKMFSSVNLGMHEERLKIMLIEESPGEPEEYGIFCTIPLIEGKIYSDWILEPGWVRVNGHRYYRVVIGGLLFLFTTNENAIHPSVKPAVIQKDGTWHIIVRDIQTLPFINDWFAANACKFSE